jgi:transcriptional regulator GlxA family with amidase domain
MKKVCILVPEQSVMQTIADPQQLFTAVNDYSTAAGKEPLFAVSLVGEKKTIRIKQGLYAVRTDCQLNGMNKFDLIIIPAIEGDMSLAIKKNQALVSWVVQQYDKGAEVASLCAGAFLLAATGLLAGKKCSTHWGAQNEFREMYPDVKIVADSIITEEKRIYSSGGSHSYWNLLLHLIEKYVDRKAAILASKYFAIDIDRDSQAVFAMFKGQKNHEDAAILKAQQYIERHIDERHSIDELSKKVAVSRRSFERRFRQATRNSVLEYIQRVKIEAAKRLFETSRKNINEVMYDVGYTDIQAFRELFKKITGLTPIEYRNKYNKLTI